MSICLKFGPLLAIFLGALTAERISAQVTSTSGNVELGRQFFRTTCAVCHGPEGDSVAGVDLGHSKFKRASSDADIVQIIRSGIPGTSMPAFEDFSEEEAGAIIVYLRSMASGVRSTSVSGNAMRGEAIFQRKGGCLNCHRVADKGSLVGPDLTEIGKIRRSFELEQSVVDPDGEILPENRFVRAVTADGTTIRGRILNHDTFSLQLIDTSERLRSFLMHDLREFTFESKSPMPSYRSKLSPEEIADLVAFLVNLRGN